MLKKKICYVPGLISLLGLPVVFFLLHPEDPVQAVAMGLRLPTDLKDSPGVVRFSRESISRRIRGKKIVSVDLDDLPSVREPELNIYRKSGFVLSEMARLQFTHDTTQLLKVGFGEESTYGQFAWAVNNARIFNYRVFFFLDGNLYFLANPPPVHFAADVLTLDSIGSPIVVSGGLPPTRWELFCAWADYKKLEALYMLRHSYLLVSGFLLLIILPVLVRVIGRGGRRLLLFCLFRRP